MLSFRFHDPWWLLLLAPIGVMAYLAVRRRPASVLYSDVRLVADLPRTWAVRVKRHLPWVFLSGAALVAVALARPQQGLEDFRIQTEGIALEMCLDRSGSMGAMDFTLDGERVDRLTAVKRVFRDFVAGDGDELPGRPDDQIGLVAFGGFADAKCPLTLDHAALLEVLDSVEIPEPIYDAQGRVVNARILEEELSTAIGDAVVLAVDRLKDAPAKSKVIILLSDGAHNAGLADPTAAAEAAKAFGVKIYTIGIGPSGMAPFPVRARSGRVGRKLAEVETDPATLEMLARETGGQHFRADDTEALKNVYARIDELEKTRSEGQLYTEYRELYRWFLLPGLALILAQVTLVSTRFRTLP